MEDSVPTVQEGLGGPQGRSGRMLKISSPPGSDPRTVQPVASRYTDRPIPAPRELGKGLQLHSSLLRKRKSNMYN
jgi:hypothetical protein